MEHRWSRRIPLELDVGVYHNDLCVTRAHTADLSPGGVGIRIDHAVLFVEQGISVCVEFPAPRSALCLPALVVHRTAERLGLMFMHDDQRVRELLGAYLDAATRRGASATAPVWQGSRSLRRNA